MEPQNVTPQDPVGDTPNAEEPSRAAQIQPTRVCPDVPTSTLVASVNETVLGLSPAVTLAGAYLGTGLASQLGFFSAANQYQQQSMVSMAAATVDVCRLLAGRRHTRGGALAPHSTNGLEAADEPEFEPDVPAQKALRAQDDSEEPSPEPRGARACEAASRAAEAAVGRAEVAVQDTGF